jgi:hypothetical protein
MLCREITAVYYQNHTKHTNSYIFCTECWGVLKQEVHVVPQCCNVFILTLSLFSRVTLQSGRLLQFLVRRWVFYRIVFGTYCSSVHRALSENRQLFSLGLKMAGIFTPDFSNNFCIKHTTVNGFRCGTYVTKPMSCILGPVAQGLAADPFC